MYFVLSDVLCAFQCTLYFWMYFVLLRLKVQSTSEGRRCILTEESIYFLPDMKKEYRVHWKVHLCTFGCTLYFRMYFVLSNVRKRVQDVLLSTVGNHDWTFSKNNKHKSRNWFWLCLLQVTRRFGNRTTPTYAI